MSLALFWVLAVVSVGSAIGVVLHRNPGRSALLLVLNFICLAVFYVMLNAQVLAALQVIVYAGAIMVLFLFVIMLLNLGGEQTHEDPLVGQRFLACTLALALLAGVGYGIAAVASVPQAPTLGANRILQAEQQGVSQIQILGWDLFTRYVYPFELTSVLLLVGVIGVIHLTKRRADSEASHGRP